MEFPSMASDSAVVIVIALGATEIFAPAAGVCEAMEFAKAALGRSTKKALVARAATDLSREFDFISLG